MIAIPSLETVLITPPKCGSTALHHHYCWDTNKGIFIIGPQGTDGVIDKHTVNIPYNFKEWKRYVIIRNPRDRFLSLYWHYCRHTQNISYERYVNAFEMGLLNWFYQWSIAKLVESLDNYELVDILDFEKKFNVTIPKINVAQNKTPLDKAIVPDSWIEHDIPKGTR